MILTFSLSLSTLQIIYKGNNNRKRKIMPSACFELVVLTNFSSSYYVLNKAN